MVEEEEEEEEEGKKTQRGALSIQPFNLDCFLPTGLGVHIPAS